MRSIGNEAILQVYRLTNTVQQPIDRHDKRTNLCRHAAFVQRMQCLIRTLIDFTRQQGDRAEQFAYQIADNDQQHREKNEKRQQAALGAFSGIPIAGAGFLRYRDTFPTRSCPDQYAERLAAHIKGREAIRQRRRHCQRRAGVIIVSGPGTVCQVLDDHS
ncbi:NhaP-type Na+/H+ or K+/H+ antiporter [Pseudomonas syringae pv. actinidiae]|uniref:NhaP-type Na+/H+ or K+/H+ antiporter n=1 Tax=Pseudomonas syringae pv. actinidiae TaxID=103796 RepID=A0A2V0QLP8_PSESF|nr:NhaP-type Na+/H+ or K+/H+ antiporter [Pseudomonas syringae pv. actinidiae]